MGISSVEAICNMALGYAGVRTRISSIDEKSVAAEQCKNYYEAFRDELLNDHPWPFAGRYATLVQVTGAAWAVGTTYSAQSYATLGNAVYRSLADGNTGNSPDTSPAWWVQVSSDEWGYVYRLPTDLIDTRYVYPKPNQPSSGAYPGRTPRSDQRIPFTVVDANDGSQQSLLLTDCQNAVLFYTAQITNPASFSGPFVKALIWKLAPALCLALRSDLAAATTLEKKAEMEKRESVATELRGVREDPEPVSEFEAARER